MKFLMCPPNHYAVNYSINYWMHPEKNDVHRDIARQQWTALYDKLIYLGAEIHLIDQHPKCPDMVFTANAALVLHNKAYLSSFHYGQRAKEEKYWADCFTNLKSHSIINDVYDPRRYARCDFEGAGDAIHDPHRGWIWVGQGRRTEPNALKNITLGMGIPTVPLFLTDPRFYHLDTCFAVLPHGEIVFYPNAIDEQHQKIILNHASKTIPLTNEEAMKFGANLICINNDIIIGEKIQSLKEKLWNCGYRVHEIDLSMFHKAGGSAACLVLRLDQ